MGIFRIRVTLADGISRFTENECYSSEARKAVHNFLKEGAKSVEVEYVETLFYYNVMTANDAVTTNDISEFYDEMTTDRRNEDDQYAENQVE